MTLQAWQPTLLAAADDWTERSDQLDGAETNLTQAQASTSQLDPRVAPVADRFLTTWVAEVTRLRQDERRVLDTLVDSGVARSRSEALAWCVTLVGEHADEWLANLRTAMSEVDKLRAQGPEL